MVKSYLIVAIRHLRRQKSPALISVASLVVGITCFILLMLYAEYELSYDSFHAKSDQLSLVGQHVPDWKVKGSDRFGATSGVLAVALKQDLSEVEYAARVKETDAPLIHENNGGVLGKGLYVDNDFLSMFTFPMKQGDQSSALKNPFTAVLSETMAGKLFGSENPIGKIIRHEKGRPYTVTGVVQDPPGNTHLKFDYLLSFQSMYSIRNDIETSWSIMNYATYVSLRDGVAREEFERSLTHIVNKYHSQNDKNRRYFVTPVADVHFETTMNFPLAHSIDKNYLYILVSIAFMILIVACINYINLATARAGTRSKEVGIRKTLGADRPQLVRQFLGESFVHTFIAILLSLIIVWRVFPFFREMTGNGIQLDILTTRPTLLGLLGLLLFVGFFSGSYPALLLSSLEPVNVLKSSFKSGLSGSHLRLRNVLVVFQLCVTVVLMVWTTVIQKQLQYIKHKDIGYDKENIVAVRLWDQETRDNASTIKNELLKNPDVISAAVSNVAPIRRTEANDIELVNETGETVTLPMVTTYFVDHEYLGLFHMSIIKGRNFPEDDSGNNDQLAIINETAARMAGFVDPVGKKFHKWGNEMTIIGVVKDFHFTSFKTKVDPLMFSYAPEKSNMLFVKISGNNITETMANINSTFRKFSPGFVPDYSFMNDLYAGMYRTEEESGSIALSFSMIAIVIASTGLFGLISFVVGRRAKEMGVRKILGASVLSLIWLVVREYCLLISIALLISLPVAYYVAGEWLNGFAYRTEMSAWIFVGAAALITVIALLSIAQQTVKAAIANPAETLKYE